MTEDWTGNLMQFMLDYIKDLQTQIKILELKLEANKVSVPIDKKEYNKRFINRKYLKMSAAGTDEPKRTSKK